MQILWKSMMPGMMLTLYFKAYHDIDRIVQRVAGLERDFICVLVHDEIRYHTI